MNRVPLPSRPLIPGLPTELSPLICDHFDAVDLALVRRTNSTWDEYVCATIHRRVYALLSPHVEDYDGLAARLLAGEALIGGFAALHILFPTNPSPPYLELFVPKDADLPLVKHLVEREGFTIRPRRDDNPWEENSREEGDGTGVQPAWAEGADASTGPVDSAADRVPIPVDRYWHLGVGLDVTVLVKNRFVVYILPSGSSSPFLPLGDEFHSALFNYVGPVDFCSAYPLLTSARRGLLNPTFLTRSRDIPDWLQACHSSWEAAGWELEVDWCLWSGEDPCRGPASYGCAVAERYFGDRFCASGPVTAVRGRQPAEQCAIENIETTYWVRGGDTCGEECSSGLYEVPPDARVCIKALFDGM